MTFHLASGARETAAAAVSEAAQRLRAYLDAAFRRDNGLPARTLESSPTRTET